MIATTLLSAVVCASSASGQDGWVQLFNGRDLVGWTAKIKGHPLGENFGETFRVEDGLLKVAYDQYDRFDGRFGHLFYEQPFSHYRLRVEYRFVGEQVPGGPGWAFRNSGVMIHGQSAQSMRVDQDFPVSIEVQLLGGGGEGDRPTANLCTPGTHVVKDDKLLKRHCVNSTSETYHGDQWVTVEIEVRGHELIRHMIDGKSVLEYREPQLDPNDADVQRLLAAGPAMLDHGTISLQSESHGLEFRKVELKPLTPSVGMSSRLRSIVFHTMDPDRLAGFYRDGLGAREIGSDRDDQIALDCAGLSLVFQQLTDWALAGPGRVSLVISVDDVEAARKTLVGLGARPGLDGWLVDPDGNAFRLVGSEPAP